MVCHFNIFFINNNLFFKILIYINFNFISMNQLKLNLQ